MRESTAIAADQLEDALVQPLASPPGTPVTKRMRRIIALLVMHFVGGSGEEKKTSKSDATFVWRTLQQRAKHWADSVSLLHIKKTFLSHKGATEEDWDKLLDIYVGTLWNRIAFSRPFAMEVAGAVGAQPQQDEEATEEEDEEEEGEEEEEQGNNVEHIKLSLTDHAQKNRATTLYTEVRLCICHMVTHICVVVNYSSLPSSNSLHFSGVW